MQEGYGCYAEGKRVTAGDCVFDGCHVRVAACLPIAERAQLSESACVGAEGEWLRAARLRAAAAWEDAGDPGRYPLLNPAPTKSELIFNLFKASRYLGKLPPCSFQLRCLQLSESN